MRNDEASRQCLTDDEIYSFIAQPGGSSGIMPLETHLAGCARCRESLADLLRLLHPGPDAAKSDISEPTKDELEEMLAIVHRVAQKERPRAAQARSWLRRAVAAAAAVGFLAIGLASFKYVYERNKSRNFYLQAKVILEENYEGKSPSNLRLALPLHPTVSNRISGDHDTLWRAEGLLNQALGVRDDMVEAHLGLAFVYLSESRFTQAREEFQKAMDTGGGGAQALLGRGVSQYEESVHALDPVQCRTLLAAALSDFDAVLQLNPDSPEARYDRSLALFEAGRHNEALEEIEKYLSADSASVWAQELRRLRTKIRATRSSAVEEELNRAAKTRDRAALEELGQQAPWVIPAAIRSALRRSLPAENPLAKSEGLRPEDLRWAAKILEDAYGSATGDRSLQSLIRFYEGLSPGQIAVKRVLDQRFQNLVKLHRSGDLAAALNGSKSLEYEYAGLSDFWQIANIHHLRGNTLYYGKADYEGARIEYGKMLEIAERVKSSDLIAKALGVLALVYSEQSKYDDALRCAAELRTKASAYHLDPLWAYSGLIMGDLFQRLGRLDQSLEEYAGALRIAYRLRDEGILIDSLENSGLAMDRQGRLQDARSSYQAALEQQNEFLQNQTAQPAPAITARRLNLIYKQGDLTLRIGDLASAESFFRECLKSVPMGMRELEARNRLGLVQVYISQKRMREAEDMLAGVDASGQYPEINWQARFFRGVLLEEEGDHAGALLSLHKAVQVLEQMRRNVRPGDLREEFLTDRYDPYRTIVAILHQSLDDRRGAFEYIDRAKSITLKEQLPLQDTTSGPAAALDLTQCGLPASALLEYFFIRDNLLIFVESQGRLHSVCQHVTTQELRAQVNDYVQSIAANNLSAFSALSRRLFAELIAPIEKELIAGNPELLMIIPDGPLHLLPFASLQDERGRFLIEKAAIASAPSRSVLRHCIELGRGRKSATPSVLLIDGSANLPSARNELAFLLNLYGRDARMLTKEEQGTAGQAAGGSDIIHFAGHSAIREGKPVLRLKGPPAEYYLDSATISSWNLPRARLVYLAGCSTGIGPLGAGETPWGLIPAFLHAGAPAVVASLLTVDDTATQVLTSQFYEQLRRNATSAGALQKAQLVLLGIARAQKDLKPQNWAPYILVGNPQ